VEWVHGDPVFFAAFVVVGEGNVHVLAAAIDGEVEPPAVEVDSLSRLVVGQPAGALKPRWHGRAVASNECLRVLRVSDQIASTAFDHDVLGGVLVVGVVGSGVFIVLEAHEVVVACGYLDVA
jgi:hypothetical protein